MIKNIYYFSLLSLFLGCGESDGELFQNPPAEETGIDFVNTITETEDLNILDYLYFYKAGGVADGDINGHQLPDKNNTGNQLKNK